MRGNQSAVMWASVTYFLMGSIAYTFVNIPHGSLAAALTQNANERSKLTNACRHRCPRCGAQALGRTH
ncbi:MFS transporter [Changpingibacter yushuensis]